MKLLIIFVTIQCLYWFSFSRQDTPVYKGLKCTNPKQNTSIPITVNGCGPQNQAIHYRALNRALNVIGFEFKECCNAHDRCFSLCKNTETAFKNCNDDFYKCMVKECGARYSTTKGVCETKAGVFLKAVSGTNGHDAYESDQKKFCLCPARKRRFR